MSAIAVFTVQPITSPRTKRTYFGVGRHAKGVWQLLRANCSGIPIQLIYPKEHLAVRCADWLNEHSVGDAAIAFDPPV